MPKHIKNSKQWGGYWKSAGRAGPPDLVLVLAGRPGRWRRPAAAAAAAGGPTAKKEKMFFLRATAIVLNVLAF